MSDQPVPATPPLMVDLKVLVREAGEPTTLEPAPALSTVRRAGECTSAAPRVFEHLAGLIHDDVLQSIGVSILQVDLCRRLWETGQDQQAATELANLLAALESAVDGLRHVVGDLRQAGAAYPPTA